MDRPFRATRAVQVKLNLTSKGISLNLSTDMPNSIDTEK